MQYVVDMKRVILRKLKLAIADGIMKADGQVIYAATDLRVGLFEAASNPRPREAAPQALHEGRSRARRMYSATRREEARRG